MAYSQTTHLELIISLNERLNAIIREIDRTSLFHTEKINKLLLNCEIRMYLHKIDMAEMIKNEDPEQEEVSAEYWKHVYNLTMAIEKEKRQDHHSFNLPKIEFEGDIVSINLNRTFTSKEEAEEYNTTMKNIHKIHKEHPILWATLKGEEEKEYPETEHPKIEDII